MQEGVIDGSHVAIDSAAIHSYEKKQPKRKCELTGNANWCAKFDSFRNKVKWFGNKLHLAVDTTRELPMALSITPAHVNDGDMAPALYLITMCMVMTNPDVRALHHHNVEVKKIKKMKSIMKLCGKVARMFVGLAKSSETYDSTKVFPQAA